MTSIKGNCSFVPVGLLTQNDKAKQQKCPEINKKNTKHKKTNVSAIPRTNGEYLVDGNLWLLRRLVLSLPWSILILLHCFMSCSIFQWFRRQHTPNTQTNIKKNKQHKSYNCDWSSGTVQNFRWNKRKKKKV